MLSTARDKKIGCPSKMSIKLLPINAVKYVCQVQLWWINNHSIDCFHVQTFGQISPATTETFHDYFVSGMSAAEAFHHHESELMNDPSTVTLLANRFCPSATDVRKICLTDDDSKSTLEIDKITFVHISFPTSKVEMVMGFEKQDQTA